jgi:hypothetical protein
VAGLSLNVLDGNEFEDNQILLIAHVNANPIKAVRQLGIDTKFLCPHDDPYTQYRSYGIIPTAVLTKDVSKYKDALKNNPFADLSLDHEFVKEHYGGDTVDSKCGPKYNEIFETSQVQTIMLGTGYTYGCSHHDGSHSCIPAKMKLSNGDWLFVWFWEWYNK